MIAQHCFQCQVFIIVFKFADNNIIIKLDLFRYIYPTQPNNEKHLVGVAIVRIRDSCNHQEFCVRDWSNKSLYRWGWCATFPSFSNFLLSLKSFVSVIFVAQNFLVQFWQTKLLHILKGDLLTTLSADDSVWIYQFIGSWNPALNHSLYLVYDAILSQGRVLLLSVKMLAGFESLLMAAETKILFF